MSTAVGAALVSLLVPLACIAWNMGLPRWAMKAWMERLVTGMSVAFAVVSLFAAATGSALAVGVTGLLVSSALFALTFLTRLPFQRPAVAVGDAASDFALSDSERMTRRLSDHAGHWVVLKFYRGYWCPYCVRDLHEWEKMLDDLAARQTRLIAVSPDRLDELHEFKRKTGLRMTLLADPDNRVIRRYNLQNRNFTPRRGPFRELVIPTTILIDDHGIVRWLDQASDFRIRRPAAEIMARINGFLPGPASETCAACAEEQIVAQYGSG
jgi:peroxiredoxin